MRSEAARSEALQQQYLSLRSLSFASLLPYDDEGDPQKAGQSVNAITGDEGFRVIRRRGGQDARVKTIANADETLVSFFASITVIVVSSSSSAARQLRRAVNQKRVHDPSEEEPAAHVQEQHVHKRLQYRGGAFQSRPNSLR